MNRQQLLEVARDVLAHVPLKQLLVAGSQAFYGAARSAPDVVVQSLEVDLLLTGDDFAHRQAIEDRFGMASQYLQRARAFSSTRSDGARSFRRLAGRSASFRLGGRKA